ncbi:MAG: DUF3035 domain-containing protein [Sphingomicrobium sp.]
MRKALTSLVLLALVGTSGCALTRSKRSAADEFAVTRNAPLIIPPDYNLAPPVAGTAAVTAGDAQQQAVDALFGGPAPRSAGETSLLRAAGRDVAQVGIRSTAWDPDTRIVDKGPTTLAIVAAPSANSNVATAQ